MPRRLLAAQSRPLRGVATVCTVSFALLLLCAVCFRRLTPDARGNLSAASPAEVRVGVTADSGESTVCPPESANAEALGETALHSLTRLPFFLRQPWGRLDQSKIDLDVSLQGKESAYSSGLLRAVE